MDSNEESIGSPTPNVEARNVEALDDEALSDEQKRMLRAVRRGYRVSSVEIKDNGWQIELTYMDGSKVTVNTKMLKLKADQLQAG